MREMIVIRRAVIAGDLALSPTALSAAVEGVEAMPAAVDLASAGDAGATVHQYRRHRHAYRRGPAGLYDCGPYALHTHLQRKTCR